MVSELGAPTPARALLADIELSSGARIRVLDEHWPGSAPRSLRIERTNSTGAIFSFAITGRQARAFADAVARWVAAHEPPEGQRR